MKIGIDIMGGDYAPESTMKGIQEILPELSGDVHLVLIGDERTATPYLDTLSPFEDKFSLVHADQVVGMNDHPTRVLSLKPNSSVAVGLRLLKAGEIQGFASAGNTGALLVGSMYTVNAIPGIIRPCITSILPKVSGGSGIILDVGANADCKPDVLYQFAVLGSIFARHVYEIKNPKVGLLSIGEEEEKGNLLVQAAHEIMKGTEDFNFVGNVEGFDLFGDKADVVVTDGFTGNVVLKEAEAIYQIMKKRGLSDEYFERFNYEHYGGTPILGINSNVIIGHGISNAKAIARMIQLTIEVAEADLPGKIKRTLNN